MTAFEILDTGILHVMGLSAPWGLAFQFAPLLIGLDWEALREQVLTRTVADAGGGRSRHLCLRRSPERTTAVPLFAPLWAKSRPDPYP